jgi:hypothetical protein
MVLDFVGSTPLPYAILSHHMMPDTAWVVVRVVVSALTRFATNEARKSGPDVLLLGRKTTPASLRSGGTGNRRIFPSKCKPKVERGRFRQGLRSNPEGLALTGSAARLHSPLLDGKMFFFKRWA